MALDEVVAEVNRYSDTPLVIGDLTLTSQRISGCVRVGDVDTVRLIPRERFDIDWPFDQDDAPWPRQELTSLV